MTTLLREITPPELAGSVAGVCNSKPFNQAEIKCRWMMRHCLALL